MKISPIKSFLFTLTCFLTACISEVTPGSLTPTKTFTVTPSIIQTAQPSNTSTTSFPTKGNTEQTIYSPDELFVAKKFGEHSYPTGVETIEIQDITGSVIWKIPFEGVILGRDGDVWIEIPTQGEQWAGEPHPSLYILDWSRDSQYLYFYYRLFADGHQPLMGSFDLQRININTGLIEKVLPGTGDMAFSFSPDQEYLVYVRGQDMPRRVIIRNTSSGAEQEISLLEWDIDLDIGGFDWSPYSKHELQFLTFKEEWRQVYYLNIQELSTKLIFEFWIEEYWFDTWLPSNVVRYITYPENEITEIDIAMPTPKIIGTATITPTP